MNVLRFDKKVRVASALVEGCSLRAIERMHDVAHKTILSLCVTIGEACKRLHDALMTDLNVALIEVDEIWAFIHTKQRRLRDSDPAEYGDAYTFVALDATKKAILSYLTGKRDAPTATRFAWDLRGRILNRPQITSDGFVAYVDAIPRAFGYECDFAQVVKTYGVPSHDPHGKERCTTMQRVPIYGSPDAESMSTSYVERQNLTMRMGMRRFGRSTNGFSKKARNHCAAIALHAAFYNFCRVHSTLRCTPAMALDVADHVWSLPELLDAAFSVAPEPEPQAPAPVDHAPEAPGTPAEPAGDEKQLPLFPAAFLLPPAKA